MRRHFLRILMVVLALPVLLGSTIFPTAARIAGNDRAGQDSPAFSTTQMPDVPGDEHVAFWVVRAYYENPEMVSELAQRLEPWEVHPDQGYLVVGVNRQQLDWLIQAGFSVEIDEKLTQRYNAPRLSLPAQVSGIPGYPCYRTVEETYSSAQALAAAYPHLAEWIDIGDSWEKIQSAGSQGYDLTVLRLTNRASPGPKPVLFIMASMHAREYAPAELAIRFAEYLVEHYNKDAQVSWILDAHEVHFLLQANPDGRKQAESGILWRKNTNQEYCSPTSIYRGADLNRNFSFQWGCCNGSSSYPCSETYRGSKAASEPETQAIQNYLRAIFPDQRGPLLTDAVASDAPGLMLDLHSYGRLVLWPWSFSETTAPNHSQMQTLGRKFAFFNGYNPSQAVDLYVTDGSADDFAYGELGIPGYTFELGNDFFETCDSFESDIVPRNLTALLYAANITNRPYLTPAGPDVVGLTSASLGLRIGEPLHLTASLNDTGYSSVNGLEPSQNISHAEYTLDIPPGDAHRFAQPHPIDAADGYFDQKIETIDFSISTIGLLPGRHTLFVRARDTAGVWGPLASVFFFLFDPNTAPKLQGYVSETGSNKPLAAEIQAGSFIASSQPETGFFSIQLPPGTYDLQASAPDHSTLVLANINVSENQTVAQDFHLAPWCSLFSDDAEQASAGWTWQTPWAISPESALSPVNAWSDSPGALYSNYQDTSLISPELNLGGLSGATLSFWHQYSLEAGYDFGWVEYLTEIGGVWQRVDAYSGNQAAWSRAVLSMPALDNQPGARFRFRLKSDESLAEDGWHIDDIRFTASGAECQENLAPAASFSANSPILVGAPLVFTNYSYAYPGATYAWDFADGVGTSTERNPVYTFSAPGNYPVSLAVTNALGSDTASLPVLVTPYSFSMAARVYYQQAQPGATALFWIQLYNDGLETDTYQVNLESPWTAQIFSPLGQIPDGGQISLESGEKLGLLLQVQIPSSAGFGQENLSALQVQSIGEPALQRSLAVVSQAGWRQIGLPIVHR